MTNTADYWTSATPPHHAGRTQAGAASALFLVEVIQRLFRLDEASVLVLVGFLGAKQSAGNVADKQVGPLSLPMYVIKGGIRTGDAGECVAMRLTVLRRTRMVMGGELSTPKCCRSVETALLVRPAMTAWESVRMATVVSTLTGLLVRKLVVST